MRIDVLRSDILNAKYQSYHIGTDVWNHHHYIPLEGYVWRMLVAVSSVVPCSKGTIG